MSEAAVRTVKAFEKAALYERDFEAAMEFAHPDLTVREAPGLPYRGTYVGLEGQRQLLADVDALFEFDGGAPHVEFRGVGDDLVLGRVTGRATLRATGREIDFLVVEFFTLRDGKVADIEVFYWDQVDIIEAGRVEAAERG
jgi:uncharacterized protein